MSQNWIVLIYHTTLFFSFLALTCSVQLILYLTHTTVQRTIFLHTPHIGKSLVLNKAPVSNTNNKNASHWIQHTKQQVLTWKLSSIMTAGLRCSGLHFYNKSVSHHSRDEMMNTSALLETNMLTGYFDNITL